MEVESAGAYALVGAWQVAAGGSHELVYCLLPYVMWRAACEGKFKFCCAVLVTLALAT